jgi:hypothetical protein
MVCVCVGVCVWVGRCVCVCARACACVPGAHDAEPADGLAGGEAVVPHHPQPDERPGPPQPRAAVHRHQPVHLRI